MILTMLMALNDKTPIVNNEVNTLPFFAKTKSAHKTISAMIARRLSKDGSETVLKLAGFKNTKDCEMSP